MSDSTTVPLNHNNNGSTVTTITATPSLGTSSVRRREEEEDDEDQRGNNESDVEVDLETNDDAELAAMKARGESSMFTWSGDPCVVFDWVSDQFVPSQWLKWKQKQQNYVN